MSLTGTDSEATRDLLERVRGGDGAALDRLLAEHRPLMGEFVGRRMDRGLRDRIDVSDVVQEAQLEMARRIDDYLARRPMPFRLWACKTAYESLLRLRRQHVEAACRTVTREAALPEESSRLLADRFLAESATASRQVMKAEQLLRVQAALEGLADGDREVLLLRTFEGLGNVEAAQVLAIEPKAASKRYARALFRLRQALAGDLTGD